MNPVQFLKPDYSRIFYCTQTMNAKPNKHRGEDATTSQVFTFQIHCILYCMPSTLSPTQLNYLGLGPQCGKLISGPRNIESDHAKQVKYSVTYQRKKRGNKVVTRTIRQSIAFLPLSLAV